MMLSLARAARQRRWFLAVGQERGQAISPHAQYHPRGRLTPLSVGACERLVIYLLKESLATSTELGMRPLMERVLSRRDIL